MSQKNKQQGYSIEVCASTYVALCILLVLFQPVNCIFWPTRMLNCLVVLNCINIGEHVALLAGPTVYTLNCDNVVEAKMSVVLLSVRVCDNSKLIVPT